MHQLFLLSSILTIPFLNVRGQSSEVIFKGEGTYYQYSGGGNCSFPEPYSTRYSGALNAAQYQGAVLCGACAEVTGERGTLLVSIEDQCPECKMGDIDLEQEAFPFIADPIKGRVPISWKVVPCPVEGPVSFYAKEGTNPYWAEIQIRNHRNPIATLELLTDGNFVALTRQNYNYFTAPEGLGVSPHTFRITDSFGNVILKTIQGIFAETLVEGQHQFPDPTQTPTGVKENEVPALTVHQDPLNNDVALINNTGEMVEYEIVDLYGRTLQKNKLLPHISQNLSLLQGWYFLHLFQTSTSYLVKPERTPIKIE